MFPSLAVLKLLPLTETITLSIVVFFGTINQDFIPDAADIVALTTDKNVFTVNELLPPLDIPLFPSAPRIILRIFSKLIKILETNIMFSSD